MASLVPPSTGKTALVVGGGLVGLEAATELRRRGLGVTLVAGRTTDLGEQARIHGFTLVRGVLGRIEARRKIVRVDGLDLTADYLVFAIGAVPLRPKGIEHTYPLRGNLEDVARIQARLAALVTRGRGRIAMGFGVNPEAPRRAQAALVLELLSEVDRLLKIRRLQDAFQLTLFAPMSPERIGLETTDGVRALLGQHVKTRFGDRIESFDAGGVELASGERIHSDLTVFVPAKGGHPVVRASDLPSDGGGFVLIDAHSRVEGMRGVYALGELAGLDAERGRARARVVADDVAAERKRTPPPLPTRRAQSSQRDS